MRLEKRPLNDVGLLGYNSGLATDLLVFEIEGFNPDFDNNNAPEDIVSTGGIYGGFPATADTVDVVSTSANDDVGGTGTESVKIFGLNSLWELDSEVIDMNGTTAATSIKSFIRVYAANAEDGDFNDGAITVSQTNTPLNEFGIIEPGTGDGAFGVFTIPDGFFGYLIDHNIVLADAAGWVNGSIYYGKDGKAPLLTRKWSCKDDTPYYMRSDGSLLLEPRSDITFRGTDASGQNLEVISRFRIAIGEL